jgi:hypothetical protein
LDLGNSPPYYLRLRIYAKQVSYFYHKLRQLDPVYDSCPVRCLAPHRDKQNGCPDCSYTVYYNALRANYYKHLTKDLAEALQASGFDKEKALREGGKLARLDWSFEDIETDYRILSELESQAGTETELVSGGFNPLWSIRVYHAISIIREERYRVRREINHKEKEDAIAAARAKELAKQRG